MTINYVRNDVDVYDDDCLCAADVAKGNVFILDSMPLARFVRVANGALKIVSSNGKNLKFPGVYSMDRLLEDDMFADVEEIDATIDVTVTEL